MNSQSTLIGLFKETYGDSIVEAWGYMAKLANRLEFVQKELQPGNFYHQPVDVQFEHGLSVAAAGQTMGISTNVFMPATAGQMQDAQVAGSQILGRSLVSYEAIARSANSKAAFKSATQHVVRRLSQATLKRLEIQLLHGARGIGTITGTPTNGSAAITVTISDESWSAGIWAGLINAPVDIYQSDLSTIRQAGNKNNGSTIVTTVTAIDTVNKTVTITESGGAVWSGVVAGDVIFPATAFGGASASEMYGIDFITRLTSSSSTFQNINPATYDLWRGNQYSTSTGTISFPKLLEGCGLMASYNMFDDALAIVAPRAFEVLNSDIAALRHFDVSYTESRGKTGFKGLQFYCQTGMLEVMPHAFQKDGLVHIIAPNEAMRVGAADVGFITRQGSEDKLILESSSSAGAEMRCYSNQAVLLPQPRHSVLFGGVTY